LWYRAVATTGCIEATKRVAFGSKAAAVAGGGAMSADLASALGAPDGAAAVILELSARGWVRRLREQRADRFAPPTI
jgi:hypothetical protein